jgi:hypothetical protein
MYPSTTIPSVFSYSPSSVRSIAKFPNFLGSSMFKPNASIVHRDGNNPHRTARRYQRGGPCFHSRRRATTRSW